MGDRPRTKKMQYVSCLHICPGQWNASRFLGDAPRVAWLIHCSRSGSALMPGEITRGVSELGIVPQGCHKKLILFSNPEKTLYVRSRPMCHFCVFIFCVKKGTSKKYMYVDTSYLHIFFHITILSRKQRRNQCITDYSMIDDCRRYNALQTKKKLEQHWSLLAFSRIIKSCFLYASEKTWNIR